VAYQMPMKFSDLLRCAWVGGPVLCYMCS